MSREDPHPTKGMPYSKSIRLAGKHAQGVAAADVDVARGRDGGWYSRWSFHIDTTGSATPIGHSEAFASEREAIDARLILIRDKARRILAARPDCYTDGDRQWCRKIEAWAVDQLAPQQNALNF
jgi:hypothetical protein